MNPTTSQSPDDKILEMIQREFASNRRWLHRFALVAALVMLGVILALWITEPRPLLMRLHVSFGIMSLVAIGWTFVLANILLRKNCPTAWDKIATAWMSVIGCTTFLVASQIVSWLRGDKAAMLTLAIVGLTLFATSIFHLRHAYKWQESLRQRLTELSDKAKCH